MIDPKGAAHQAELDDRAKALAMAKDGVRDAFVVEACARPALNPEGIEASACAEKIRSCGEILAQSVQEEYYSTNPDETLSYTFKRTLIPKAEACVRRKLSR